MPRVKKSFEPMEQQIGQDREVMIALEGPAEITGDDIEIIPGPKLGNKAEIERFMHEDLDILIFPATEKYPENPVYVSVNGKGCYIFRNIKSRVKRKYVYQLCKAKQEGISQNTEADDPAEFNKLAITTTLRYPFTVSHDPSGAKGHEWLQTALATA